MTGLKILCGAAALLSSTSAFAQTGNWTVSEASGRVVMRDASGDHVAQRGSLVPAGATLMTAAGARAVLVRGEDFVTVAANSRLRLPAAEQAAGMFQMIEEWGNAVFRIKHLPKPHFAVQTPYLAAVVKGTTFSVTVTREGTSLQVIDGAVEVATTDGGAHDMVRPGVVASVAAADRFRLSMQGQGSRVLDSPQRPAGAGVGAPAAKAEVMPHGDGGSAGGHGSAHADKDDVSWSDVSGSVIAAPIEAKPVDLSAVTGGMVTGHSGGELAASVAAPTARGEVELASNGVALGRGGKGGGKGGKTDPAGNGAPGAADNGGAKPDQGVGGSDDANGNQNGNCKGADAKNGKNGKGDPGDAAPKPGKDDPADAKPKPGKDDPADAKPEPGKDNPADAKPKPGKDDPADAKPEPGKDDPAAKPAKDDPKGDDTKGKGKD